MSTQGKKKTLAQFRLERERHERDFDLGCQIADDVIDALNATTDYGAMYDVREDTFNAILAQADLAVSLLQFRPDTGQYRLILAVRGDTEKILGQYRVAEAMFRQADEAFAMAERNGTLTGQGYESWMLSLIHLGNLYLNSQQLESAKRCFLRLLDLPHQRARDRGGALQGLARYHKERKDWPAVIECCKQAFLLFSEAKEGLAAIGRFEERLLLLLADAAEAQGDMRLAQRYGKKAKKVPSYLTSTFPGFLDCDRREAMQLLAVGGCSCWRWEDQKKQRGL